MTAKPPPMMTAAEIRRAIEDYYDKPGNAAGGILHVVLDDCNLHDCFLNEHRAKATELGDEDAIRILDALQERSLSRRIAIVP